MKPVAFDVDFDFNLSFNNKNINKEYEDLDEFYTDVLRRNFSTNSILNRINDHPLENFKIKFCTSSTDTGIKDLFNHYKVYSDKKNFHLGFILFLESKDAEKGYKIEQLKNIGTYLVKIFEKVILTDTPYYTIKK
jgi:hypothetical protein